MNVNFLKKTILMTFSFLLAFSILANTDFIEQLSLKNAKSFSSLIITGGQPSVDDLTLLAKNGVKKIINLRPISEFSDFDEKAKVDSLTMEYINIPVDGAQAINLTNLALFSKALTENSKQKILVHCASGNRVGAFFALDAYFNQHKSLEIAIEVGKKAGMTRLEQRVRSLITQESKHTD